MDGRMIDATCDASVTSIVLGTTPPLTDAQAPAPPNDRLPSGGCGLEATVNDVNGDENGVREQDELSDATTSGKRKRSTAATEEEDEGEEGEARAWTRPRVDSESDVEIEAIIEDPEELTAEEADHIEGDHRPSGGNESPSEDVDDADDLLLTEQGLNESMHSDDAAQNSRLDPHVYYPDDEELMEAVVDGMTRGLRPLYQNLRRSLGGRFARKPISRVSNRVYWLRDLWLNPAHQMHGDMTPKLKSLVAQYIDLSPRKRITGRVSSEDADCIPADDGGDGLIPTLASSMITDIDSDLEEKVARIVLKHSPDFFTAPSKLLVWQAIAVASRGRYKTASSAKLRTEWLCKVASSPQHRKYHQLTPALRRMLLTIQGHSNGETATADPSTTISERKDKLLMELVLLQRPFEHDDESKSAVWAEIVAAVKHPVVVDATSAEKRVLFLMQAVDNRQHGQHASLSKKLSFLVRKYKRIVGNVARPESPSNVLTPEHIAADTTSTQRLANDREDPEAILDDTQETNVRQLPTSSMIASSPSEFMVTSLTNQVAKLESEQRELRGELRELRVELRSQRECHHRETTAMLELLEKERQDRKDAFTAMIGLLTRFGVPQGAPQATAFTESSSNSSTTAHSIENCVI